MFFDLGVIEKDQWHWKGITEDKIKVTMQGYKSSLKDKNSSSFNYMVRALILVSCYYKTWKTQS